MVLFEGLTHRPPPINALLAALARTRSGLQPMIPAGFDANPRLGASLPPWLLDLRGGGGPLPQPSPYRPRPLMPDVDFEPGMRMGEGPWGPPPSRYGGGSRMLY